MQNFNYLIDKITQDKPKLVYISGKTCTGKTTLTKLLASNFECKTIELDSVVSNIQSPDELDVFVEIYRTGGSSALSEQFVTNSQQIIISQLLLNQFVIIEGALSHTPTIKKLIEPWKSDFMFVYLLPTDESRYQQRIIDRLIHSEKKGAGLPANLTKRLYGANLDLFYGTKNLPYDLKRVIEQYAFESMLEAKQRLEMFENDFSNITVVEV